MDGVNNHRQLFSNVVGGGTGRGRFASAHAGIAPVVGWRGGGPRHAAGVLRGIGESHDLLRAERLVVAVLRCFDQILEVCPVFG